MSNTTNNTMSVLENAQKKVRAKSYLVRFNDSIERVKAILSEDNETYKTSEETSRTFKAEDIITDTRDRITTSNDFDYNIYPIDDYEVHATKIYKNQLSDEIKDFSELKDICNKQIKNSTRFGNVNKKNICKATYIYIGHDSIINYYKASKTIEMILSPIDIELMQASAYNTLLQECSRKDERKVFEIKVDKIVESHKELMKCIIPNDLSELKNTLKTITCKTDRKQSEALTNMLNK